MDIYNYKSVVFIISKFQLQFQFEIDHSINSKEYA
jgi:hypothetical protein